MEDECPLPVLEVAVAVLKADSKFLALYNPKWGEFTLPMTKRRVWKDPEKFILAEPREEDWDNAAARAACEALGRSLEENEKPQKAAEVIDYRQGDRDGLWKRYHFQVFIIDLDNPEAVKGQGIMEWWDRDDFQSRKPVSPTARMLIKQVP